MRHGYFKGKILKKDGKPLSDVKIALKFTSKTRPISFEKTAKSSTNGEF